MPSVLSSIVLVYAPTLEQSVLLLSSKFLLVNLQNLALLWTLYSAHSRLKLFVLRTVNGGICHCKYSYDWPQGSAFPASLNIRLEVVYARFQDVTDEDTHFLKL